MPDLSQYDYKKSFKEKVSSATSSIGKFFVGKAYPAVAVLIVAVGVSTVIATRNMSNYNFVSDADTVIARGQRYKTHKDAANKNIEVASAESVNEIITSQLIDTFVIQAEDYDEGGQDVAYHDNSKGNYGGSYRNDDVDIGGSAVVGWIDGGEWLSYDVSVDAGGSYDIRARVARANWQGDFPVYYRLELDGQVLTNDIEVNITGGWSNFVDLSSGTEYIEPGNHKLVIRFLENENRTNIMNLDWISFTPSDQDDGITVPTNPEPGTPPPADDNTPDDDPVLITIQSENYGTEGEGNSYHDADPQNRGGEYRDDGVDIESTEINYDGYSIGWINSGEWLKYTFNASGPGKYNTKIRVARRLWQGNVDVGFILELDGQDISGNVAVNGTGDWSNWVTIDGPSVDISKGQHTLVFKVQDNGRQSVFNVDWIKFVPEGETLVEPVIPVDPVDPVTPDPVDPVVPPPTPPSPPPVTAGGYDSSTVGPQASITCSGVNIYPGDSISSKASSYAEDTTFCIKKGTYYGQSVTPKKGQKFIGEKGAIMDGQNSVTYAFNNANSTSRLYVTIKNLEIKNYNGSIYIGVISSYTGANGWYDSPIWGPGGWVVENCYVHNNRGSGITLHRDNAVIQNNIVNYNGQVGINFRFGQNQKALNNEIAWNDPAGIGTSWGNEGGGSKFWDTKNLVLDSNYVHDNHGPGLWADYNNINTTYSNNHVEDNYADGIFQEISYSATVYGNTVINNGWGRTDASFWGAGILMADSGPATIYDNYLENNHAGIFFTSHSQRNGSPGPDSPSGDVYNNTISNSGVSGSYKDGASIGPFNWYDNSLTGNSYTMGL